MKFDQMDFFEFNYSDSATSRCLQRRGQSKSGRLNRNELDQDWLRDLQLACCEHRELLFQLGDKHGIKLHYGACLSMVEILAVLYLYWTDIREHNQTSGKRDHFILSKGHAAPSLYVMLYQAGLVKGGLFSNYRAMDSIFQGHPDRNKIPAVDCSTGSLGQGLGVAAGLAWGMRRRSIDRLVYCLLSDGECNEGSVWEAALIAANAKLDNLVAIVDRNRKSSYGTMAGRNDVEPLDDKWRAFGWDVYEVDGHSVNGLISVFAKATEESRKQPVVLIANTVKGKGIPYAEKNFVRSSSSLSADQLAEARAGLTAIAEGLRS